MATTVTHVAIEVHARHRATMLEDIITFYGKGSHAIVFTQTKRECDELAAGQTFNTLTSQVCFGVWFSLGFALAWLSRVGVGLLGLTWVLLGLRLAWLDFFASIGCAVLCLVTCAGIGLAWFSFALTSLAWLCYAWLCLTLRSRKSYDTF